MGCFRIDLTSPLELLFYGLSLLQAFRAVQLAARIGQDWSEFRLPPLTRHKMRLVEQGAFLLAIPPSVVVHEYFHAIPIWLFGGRVASCGYGFYWGYVQADRFFPATQDWIISLGGTIGSLLFAAVLYGLLRRNQSGAIRYFGRQSLKTLLYYSLIYYPIFTAVTFIGDWRVIYNFGQTPVLSGATAVAHLLLLLGFWQARRRGWFEMVGQPTEEAAAQFAQLEADWQHNPQDAQLALRYVDALRRGGAAQKATAVLQRIIAHNPNLAGAYVQLALVQADGKQNVPRTAVQNLEKAVQLGLDSPHLQAIAHQMLGQYQLAIGKNDLALQHLDQAIAAVTGVDQDEINPLFQAQLYHLRSLVYQRKQQPDQARQDAEQAVSLAQATGNDKVVAYYQREMEILHQQNGRV